MEGEKLRELRLAYPFKPFFLVMADGRKLPVDQPYYLAFDHTASVMAHESAGGGTEIVYPEDVLDIDFRNVRRPKSRRPQANGRRRDR